MSGTADVIIFQILGVFRKYSPVEFVIDNFTYNTTFASVAVAKYKLKQNKKPKIIFLVPNTLALAFDIDINSTEALKRKTSELLSEKIENNEQETIDFEVAVFDGLLETESLIINNHIGNVILEFFDILVTKSENAEEIYFVTSTGHNIYVVAFTDALRYYIVNQKLTDLFQKTNTQQTKTKAIAHQIFHDPIPPSKTAKISIEPYDVKAFLSIPYTQKISLGTLISNNLSKKEKEELGRYLNKHLETLRIKTLLSKLKLLFNAIINNTPLALMYTKEFYQSNSLEKPEDIKQTKQEFIKLMTQLIINRKKQNDNEIRYPKLKHRNIINIYLSLSLLESILKFLHNKYFPKIQYINGEKYIAIDDLKEIFLNLYKKENLNLPVNSRFLERDIKEIKNITQKLKNHEEKTLKELFESPQNESKQPQTNTKKESDPKRNFFAHSGFIRNYTIARKEQNKIYLRYDTSKLKEIKSWLLT